MNAKTVVLTFDDAVSNHATLVAPLLQQYQFNATFYICEFPPDFGTNKQQYMTWEQIRTLDSAGFEIGNHTLTHAIVTELKETEFEEELLLLEQRCRNYDIRHPETFAYPSCVFNEHSFSVLRKKQYRFARIGGKRPFIPGQDDPLQIPSFPVHGNDKQLFYGAVDQAAPNVIPVLMFHGIPEYAHPWVNTPPEFFMEYMRYLSKNNFRVIAMRDLADYELDASLPASV